MIRRWWLVAPMLLLGGCEGQICALLGTFQGVFGGDVEGGLDALVTEDPDDADMVNVNLTLTSDIGLFDGEAKVSCNDGDLVLDLTDVDGATVGLVTGLVEEGKGQGAYELLGGETGTWEY